MRVCLESWHLKSDHASTVSPTKLSHIDWDFRGERSKINLKSHWKNKNKKKNVWNKLNAFVEVSIELN